MTRMDQTPSKEEEEEEEEGAAVGSTTTDVTDDRIIVTECKTKKILPCGNSGTRRHSHTTQPQSADSPVGSFSTYAGKLRKEITDTKGILYPYINI